MKITDIDVQKKNKNRVSVFVDGEYSFSLEKIDALRLSLKIGMEITDADIQKYNIESNLGKARSKAGDMLSRRPYSSHDFKSKLLDKGFDEVIVNSVLEEFSELGYLNDLEYAKMYIEDARLKLKGDKKIMYELSLKGIGERITREALAECEDVPLEDVAAIINTKYASMDITDYKIKQKITAYLASRGFSYSDINDAIRCAVESRENIE